MEKLNDQQEAAIRWHLQNNVNPIMSDTVVDKIIADVNAVRIGEKTLDDEIDGMARVSLPIREMIEDLKLSEYVEPEEEKDLVKEEGRHQMWGNDREQAGILHTNMDAQTLRAEWKKYWEEADSENMGLEEFAEEMGRNYGAEGFFFERIFLDEDIYC